MFNGLFFVLVVAITVSVLFSLLNYFFSKGKKKKVVPNLKNDTKSLKEYQFRYNNIKED